jgi:hypothetical protein
VSNVKYISGVDIYNISCDDDIIYVDTSLSPVTIVLPNIQNSGQLSFVNKIFTISDFTNNAAINNITILAAGNTVNSGQDTAILSNNGSAFATIVGLNSWQVTTDNPITNGLTYMGTWNAYTNDPTLVSSVGIAGQYYIVSVAGTTNLNGTTDWNVGDWAIFVSGTTNAWQKIDNHDIQSYNFIQDDGSALPQQSVIDFQGAGVTATNGTGKTIVTIPIQPAYATIQDEGGSLTQRTTLNFTGSGVTASDIGGKTQVNIPTQQAYTTIQDEGSALTQTNIIDFQGDGVIASNGSGKTIVTVAGAFPTTGYGLFSQTSNGTPVTATTVETNMIGAGVGTLTVPANGFKVGDSFACALDGVITCISSATLHIHVKTLAGVILADTGIITMAAATNKSWIMNLYFTIRTLGATGTASISSGGLFSYIRNGGTQFEGYVLSTINNTTFDTTISNTLIITAQWNTNNAGNSIYSRNFTLIKIY